MGFFSSLLNIGAAFATGGASIYWQVAAMAYNLFSGGQDQKGPRVSDLDIALDGEGQTLERGWGRWARAVRLVWTTGLIEKTKTKKKGGLFGIGGNKITTFQYGTECLAIGGRGPATRLMRLKLNQYVLYDYNDGVEQGGQMIWNGQYWEGVTRLRTGDDPITIYFYPGTLDQPVYPPLADAKGEGLWTNYPGQWLIGLKIPDLGRYGNSMPRIYPEVYYSVTALPDVIREVGSWVNLEADDFDLSALGNLSVAPHPDDGFVVDSRKKANDIIGELMDLFHFSLPEVDGVLRAVLRPSGPVFNLAEKDLRVRAGYASEEIPKTPYTQTDETSLSQIKEILFRDPARDYATGYRFARRFQGEDDGTRRKSSFQTSAAMSGPRASGIARVLLAEEWAAVAPAFEGYIGVENLDLCAGDEGWIQTVDGPKYVVIDSLTTPLFGPIKVNFQGLDPLVYNLPERDETAGLIRKTPIEPGFPIGFAAECPLARGNAETNKVRAVVIGVCRSIRDSYWSGADVIIDLKRPGNDWKRYDHDDTGVESIIGELTTDWIPSSPEDGFTAGGFTAQVWGGSLHSTASRDDAASGANLWLFENGLCVLVETVGQTGSGPDSKFYSITSLQSGVFGSDDFLAPLTAGTRFIVLSDQSGDMVDGPYWNVVDTTLPIGTLMRVRFQEQEGNGEEVTVNLGELKGENVRPPSPVIELAQRNLDGSLRIKGRARSRFYENNFSLDANSNRIDEPTFSGQYKFSLQLEADGQSASLDQYTSDEYGAFDWTIDASELDTLLGAPGAISGTVALYGYQGAGRLATFQQTEEI